MGSESSVQKFKSLAVCHKPGCSVHFNSMNDWELLQKFVADGSEEAFEALALRYSNMVQAAAYRQTGDANLAQDVAQAVFLILARKAETISRHTVLAGWLLKTTRFVALDARKTQRRRQIRESEAQMIQEKEETNPLEEQIDEALSKLSPMDRDILILRYVKNQSFSAMAEKLEMKEAALRQRSHRAIEKLRQLLLGKRVAVTSTLLTTWFAGRFTHAHESLPPARGVFSLKSLRMADTSFKRLILHSLGPAMAGLVIAGTAALGMIMWLRPPLAQMAAAPLNLSLAAEAPPISQANQNPFSWDQLKSTDYKTYVENLRSISCPESTIREIVIAAISRKYGQQMLETSARMITLGHLGHDGDADTQSLQAHLLDLKQQKRSEIEALFGPDSAMDLALISEDFSSELAYGWLPRDKREQVKELEAKYHGPWNSIARESTLFHMGAEDDQRRKVLNDHKYRELARVLSPEELKEYEIRDTELGMRLRINQFFRAEDHEINAIYDAENALKSLSEIAGETAEAREQRLIRKQNIMEGLRAQIGEDRLESYELSKDLAWRESVGFASRFGLEDEKRDLLFETLKRLDSEIKRSGNEQVSTGFKAETRASLMQLLGPELFRKFMSGGEFEAKRQLRE